MCCCWFWPACIVVLSQCQVNTESGGPEDELTTEAVAICKKLGSNATRVSEITGGRDRAITTAIQQGITRVNEKATSNAQRIQKWIVLERDFSIIGGELGECEGGQNDGFLLSILCCFICFVFIPFYNILSSYIHPYWNQVFLFSAPLTLCNSLFDNNMTLSRVPQVPPWSWSDRLCRRCTKSRLRTFTKS